EAAVEKIAHVPLSADTVTRRIEEIAEDIEAQLFERINASPWYALQVDESTDIDNKAILLAYVHYLYQEDVHEDLLCALPLPTNTTGEELFKSLDGYISRQLKWFFCVGICKDGAAAMTGRLSGLTARLIMKHATPLAFSNPRAKRVYFDKDNGKASFIPDAVPENHFHLGSQNYAVVSDFADVAQIHLAYISSMPLRISLT
ncbi:SCAN domain-containing protein 3, partial [Trichonephila inaurata madagascariensis]